MLIETEHKVGRGSTASRNGRVMLCIRYCCCLRCCDDLYRGRWL